MKQIALIAALDSNNAIGFDNQLPWHLPDDLKRFKALTTGKTILMGRKTAQSLGRALPNRQNLVLSRSAVAPYDGMQIVNSWKAALDACESDELMVIGGGEIYALAMPVADRLYLTHVDTQLMQADAYFPAVDPRIWQATGVEAHESDGRHAFRFNFTDYLRATD